MPAVSTLPLNSRYPRTTQNNVHGHGHGGGAAWSAVVEEHQPAAKEAMLPAASRVSRCVGEGEGGRGEESLRHGFCQESKPSRVTVQAMHPGRYRCVLTGWREGRKGTATGQADFTSFFTWLLPRAGGARRCTRRRLYHRRGWPRDETRQAGGWL